MRFVIMLDPQLLLMGYSEELVGEPARNERYVFESDGKGNNSFQITPQGINRIDYLDAGYVEVTKYATKASTFEGHNRNLQKFDQKFRSYWERGSDSVNEPAVYANPLNAMLKWAREKPGIGAPGQMVMSLPLIPVLREPAAPSKYEFCR